MKYVDLTHFISQDMPVYPGTEQPKFTPANSYEKDGFKETLLTMFSHTGTHMDPPAHLFRDKKTLDDMNIDAFIGSALVIDCTDLKDGDKVSIDHIKKYGDKAEKAEFLLFNFGYDKFWGKCEYFGDYPVLSDEVIDFIITTKKKGVGLDTIGLDPIKDASLTSHKKLFSNLDAVIIENLTNLDKLGDKLFTLFALPLKHKDADGSPIRAVACIEE